MSRVKLLPHNQETFDKIMKLFEIYSRVCAIQATGTGKSYLMCRLLEEFEDLHAIIFSPNDEIIEQTEILLRDCDLKNAECITYQKLLYMKDEDISNLEADLIIVDEFHRVGAYKWGKKIQHLLDSHENAKLFGVTATPIRPSDGKDMSQEIFHGNKACDISLAEALVREIIPVMPLYISALYTFEEEYQKMSNKINKSNNSNEEKAELQKELSAAKQQLEKANGVPEIIKKYVINYNGKYIVFCKDKTHLFGIKDVVISWFREAGYNGKIFEYPYYSNDRMVKNNLEEFKNNKREGLKLLFVINKLNEGLHLKDIQGCFLLRPTRSNITYYQQIGRAIDAGSKEKRIIFDLVCNFNSLTSFNLKKDLEEKVRERKSGKFSDCSEEFELDKFNVVDCVQGCIDVFNQIDKSVLINLKDDWTANDDNVLYEIYPKQGASGVQKVLKNRTKMSINTRASRLGIEFKWSEEEIQFLYRNCNCMTTRKIAEELGRSASCVATKMSRLGIKKNYYWTKEKIEMLIQYYPLEGTKVSKRVGMTKEQCQVKAFNLGIKYCPKTSSKYKYVTKKGNKYAVKIRINGKDKHFGTFDSEDEAGKVAMEIAKKYGKAV